MPPFFNSGLGAAGGGHQKRQAKRRRVARVNGGFLDTKTIFVEAKKSGKRKPFASRGVLGNPRNIQNERFLP